MRVAFFGNHTVGVRTLRVLSDIADVVVVVAHPPDAEDGTRYESVFNTATEMGLFVVRAKGKDERVLTLMRQLEPDLLLVADYRYLLPQSVINLAKLGAVNFHPSLLPKYRGRACINWAILKGENETGLTAHIIEEGADTGDIVEQVSVPIFEHEDVGDVLTKLFPIYEDVTRRVVNHFGSGTVPRIPQNHNEATVFSARTPDDGLIHWNESAVNVRNLVRAVAAPYPGAFTFANKRKLYVWKATCENSTASAGEQPGVIVKASDNGAFGVACGEGILHVLSWSWDAEADFEAKIGFRFEQA